MSPFSLKILIVEDNLSFALELQMLLEELGYQILDRTDNSKDALRIVYKKQPDLILMDIGIKGDLSGLDVGQKIKHLEIPILYITSAKDKQHYRAAQQSNMIGYMVKPVEKISLKTAIQLSISKAYALKNHQGDTPSVKNNIVHQDFYFFKRQDIFHKVYLKDIAFIKSDDNYCQSYTVGGKTFVTRIGISQLEKELPPKLFMRIHRQYIVQVSCIDSIDFNSNSLKISRYTIPISRTKRKALAAMLKMLHWTQTNNNILFGNRTIPPMNLPTGGFAKQTFINLLKQLQNYAYYNVTFCYWFILYLQYHGTKCSQNHHLQ